MPLFETAIGKTLAVTSRFLPQLSARAEARLITDHRPISGSPNFHDGGRFWLWVVVAPSHSPRQLEPVDFTDQAHALAGLILGDQQFEVGYSGSSECRYEVRDPGPRALTEAIHILRMYPDGRVVLQWGLRTSPMANTLNVELSLDEIVSVLCHMHEVAHDPRYAAIHVRRRTERMRRFDWRVGLTPSISVDNHGVFHNVSWRSLASSTGLPAVLPTEQNPSCPVHGFAPSRMKGVKHNASAVDTFSPALAHLLVDAGYTGGVRESVRKALAAPRSISSHQLVSVVPVLATADESAVPAIGDSTNGDRATSGTRPTGEPVPNRTTSA
ncbi:hypothetical protein [Micromonospora fulviviridis]|uniref:hypothetical protein n=1 Tax=Micromonospora fulviviridis TaxID=47860 RepID=UPI0037AD8474